MKGNDCCLSGIENICAKLQQDGAPPSYVAATCLAYLRANIEGMLHAAWQQCGKLPVLFAGGVMSNCMLRDYFTTNYQGVFAQPAYSSDNAGGIAVLAANRGGC